MQYQWEHIKRPSRHVDGIYLLTIYKVEVRGSTANANRIQKNITTVPFYL